MNDKGNLHYFLELNAHTTTRDLWWRDTCHSLRHPLKLESLIPLPIRLRHHFSLLQHLVNPVIRNLRNSLAIIHCFLPPCVLLRSSAFPLVERLLQFFVLGECVVEGCHEGFELVQRVWLVRLL
jgi:hypothetical protein